MSTFAKEVHACFQGGGEMLTKNPIGFHGTSWEAISEITKTGKLPPSSVKNNRGTHHETGRIYFFPSQESFPEHPMRSQFSEHKQTTIHDASGYARDIAGSHFLLTHLGLDINNGVADCRSTIQEYTHRGRRTLRQLFKAEGEIDEYEYLLSQGIENAKIHEAMQLAIQRKGIILAISRDVRQKFEIQIAEGEEPDDLCILCPDGLPIEYIVGIDPLGDFEYQQLDALSPN